jgi:hypothetical protein
MNLNQNLLFDIIIMQKLRNRSKLFNYVSLNPASGVADAEVDADDENRAD